MINNEKEENLEKLKGKNRSFLKAVGHAIDGVIVAFKTEKNLRIDYIIGLAILFLSLFFDFTKTEFACICLTIGFVIFAEMINSAVEYVVDLATDKFDKRAKAAKDIAAGGVLISSFVAVIVAYFLFSDKIYLATNSVIENIFNSTIYIVFTIIFVVVLLCVILKGVICKDGEYSKSSPSIRVTLAFALSTYAYLITERIIVALVTLVLSIIIAHMKIQDKKNKPAYVFLSAGIGILIVLIIYQISIISPDVFKFIETLV